MTGYKSKLAAAQDKLAQPAQDSNWVWACNECGAQEFTSALSEADLDYLACSTCGGNEFHKEALAQPAQAPVAWRNREAGGGWQYYGWEETGMTYEAVNRFNKNGFECEAIPTTPPQRIWVGLTEKEKKEIYRLSVYVEGAISLTEAKLKEKN